MGTGGAVQATRGELTREEASTAKLAAAGIGPSGTPASLHPEEGSLAVLKVGISRAGRNSRARGTIPTQMTLRAEKASVSNNAVGPHVTDMRVALEHWVMISRNGVWVEKCDVHAQQDAKAALQYCRIWQPSAAVPRFRSTREKHASFCVAIARRRRVIRRTRVG